MVQYRYVCGNCGMWHDLPFCPFRRPEPPRTFTPEEMATLRYLRQLERAGVLPMPKQPGESRFRWWWVPLGLAILFVLMILF
jgi:hypothetical protein